MTITTFGCQRAENETANPLFEEWNTPFGVPPFDKIKPSHFAPAFERAVAEHNAEIEAIVNCPDEPTFENTLLAYDRSGVMLSDVLNIFGMLCAAETNEELQQLEQQLMPAATSHQIAILLNDRLFERVRALYDDRKNQNYDAVQLRLLEKVYNDFVRSGALLPKEQKERLKAIDEQLAELSVRFGANVLAENNNYLLLLTSENVNGMPPTVLDVAREKAAELGESGKYAFTPHKPSMIPLLTYQPDRKYREEIYRAYLNRCNNGNEYDNKQIINDMVRLRCEKAKLLGYKNYAEYVTSDQMAGSPKAVYAMLDELWQPALDKAKEELDAMQAYFKEDYTEDGYKFEPWDWWYYAEKVRQDKYDMKEDVIRPYLSLDNVRQGVFNLANRLYGITFRPIAVPLYHNEVMPFEVLDADGSHLGVLYFDFHPREGKGQGAWCGYFREPRYDADNKFVSPVVGIVCNFTRPTATTPSLLTIDETQTLFHEFGHALHFLFSKVPYRQLLSVEGDFVELPSQIMENWAFEEEMLRTYAVNYRTKEIIRPSLIDMIRNASHFNQGFMLTELLAAALTDMDIHSIEECTEELDIDAFEYKSLYEQRELIPQIEPRYKYNYFAHIFSGGYSAGYYFYLWAELLDKDAFEAFRESGDIFDRRTAAKFRNEILSQGGMRDGMTLYKAFRDTLPDKKAMLKGRGLLKVEEELDDESESEKEELPADANGHRRRIIDEEPEIILDRDTKVIEL
ncbi:MAG: M3 family metallopeptidase [Alistipes sp.]|nr:M3 family metallopeptidase [Alistipes sp.]